MGLPGRPPITQFPSLTTKQDTGCRAQLTRHGKIRFPGRDTLLRSEDIESYLPRGPDMKQTRSLTYIKGTGGIYVPLSPVTHADPDVSNRE
jgi:hypothetical protein